MAQPNAASVALGTPLLFSQIPAQDRIAAMGVIDVVWT